MAPIDLCLILQCHREAAELRRRKALRDEAEGLDCSVRKRGGCTTRFANHSLETRKGIQNGEKLGTASGPRKGQAEERKGRVRRGGRRRYSGFHSIYSLTTCDLLPCSICFFLYCEYTSNHSDCSRSSYAVPRLPLGHLQCLNALLRT